MKKSLGLRFPESIDKPVIDETTPPGSLLIPNSNIPRSAAKDAGWSPYIPVIKNMKDEIQNVEIGSDRFVELSEKIKESQ